MKVHVLSDLHLEHGDFRMPEVDAEILVLAGDISVGVDTITYLNSISSQYKAIFYVPGNHEYYRNNMEELDKRLMSEAVDNVFNVSRGGSASYVDDDGNVYQFFGKTLWTDMKLFEGVHNQDMVDQVCFNALSDFHYIQVSKNEKMSVQAFKQLHSEQLYSLFMQLMYNMDKKRKNIVITHHMPSSRSVQERYEKDILSAVFASDLDKFIEDFQPDYWICGHTHDAHRYNTGKTEVICNPRGYPYEHTGFDPELVIEL